MAIEWVNALDTQRGELVKVRADQIEKLGTDEQVAVEVTLTHVFQGGSNRNVYIEMRSAKFLSVQ